MNRIVPKYHTHNTATAAKRWYDSFCLKWYCEGYEIFSDMAVIIVRTKRLLWASSLCHSLVHHTYLDLWLCCVKKSEPEFLEFLKRQDTGNSFTAAGFRLCLFCHCCRHQNRFQLFSRQRLATSVSKAGGVALKRYRHQIIKPLHYVMMFSKIIKPALTATIIANALLW